MPEKPVFLTPEGKVKFEAELAYLRDVRRKEVADRIHAAKEFSDAVDNAEFEETKNEQAFVEGRIRELEKLIANAIIIDHEAQHEVVRLGSEVTVIDEEGQEVQLTIVGSAEANPKVGKISNESPVGHALLGRRPGDEVLVSVPGGVAHYYVKAID
ncbi:MAG: transcription elongation factor GreA [Chloroflexi bacterium]|nr:transcription elongation factor GreA [Chloroflexota bacterium]